ncbi:MAG: 5-deoxy-glucuronate isomerase, partial [Pseudomonadota bacterium]
MSDLHLRPLANKGHVHAITPQSAGWSYVGFDLHRLSPGEVATAETGEREVILVLVEGKAEITADGRDFGEQGDRMDVFEKTPPHSIYIPPRSSWQATATTVCTVALCSAPGRGSHAAQSIGPAGIALTERGSGTNLRYTNNIAMEDRDVADSLLVTEVFTPAGHWSSYPP